MRKKPSAKQPVVAGVRKKLSAKQRVVAVEAGGPVKKRPSCSIVMKKPACSTSCSLSQALADVKHQSWLHDADVNVLSSQFAASVSQRLDALGILSSKITPHHVQSLLYEAEDDYADAHAHHIANGHAHHHILQYMSDRFQSSFGSVCNWMAELRFIYSSG